MIKNIVFDMGNVLLNYDGSRVCRHFLTEEKDIWEVFQVVFGSQEWVMLDLGIMEEREALGRMCGRLQNKNLEGAVKLCLEHWDEYNMWPVDGMEEVVRDLKAQGYGIYLCSNASLRLLSYYKMIPAIEMFDGVLFSAEIQYIKPQAEIYRRLFERFDIKAEECFFIDDLQANIDGAKACGMDGHCFADQDVERLKTVLAALKERK